MRVEKWGVRRFHVPPELGVRGPDVDLVLCDLFELRFELRYSIGQCFVLCEQFLGLSIELSIPVGIVFPPVNADFASFIHRRNQEPNPNIQQLSLGH